MKNKNDNAKIKKLDPENPDTDRDGIIDGIEIFVFYTRSLAYALDPDNLSRNFDGESPAIQQILEHRHPLFPDSEQIKYDFEVTQNTKVEDQDCYLFQQSTLPLYRTMPVSIGATLPGLEHVENENIVLLYYLQTPQSAPNGDAVLKYSLQKLKNDEATQRRLENSAALRVKDDVFLEYQPKK